MGCQAMTELKLLERRVAAIEQHHQDIAELIALLEDVKGALRLFIKVGKAIKWLAGFLLACSGIAWVIRHFGEGA